MSVQFQSSVLGAWRILSVATYQLTLFASAYLDMRAMGKKNAQMSTNVQILMLVERMHFATTLPAIIVVHVVQVLKGIRTIRYGRKKAATFNLGVNEEIF